MKPRKQSLAGNSPSGLWIIIILIGFLLGGSALYSLTHRHPADKADYWWDMRFSESGDPCYLNDEWSTLLTSARIYSVDFRETPSEAGVAFILEKALENPSPEMGDPNTELEVEFLHQTNRGDTPITLNLRDTYCWEALRQVAIELDCRVEVEEGKRLTFRSIDDPEVERVVAKFDGLPQLAKDGKLVFAHDRESNTPTNLADRFRDAGIALAADDSATYYPDRDVFVASTSLDQMPAIQVLNQKFVCGTCIEGPATWWEACLWTVENWTYRFKERFISTPPPPARAPAIPTGATSAMDPFL
ncbi:MAG: hypothetical protein P1U86_17665 [Verrucomicrobiales bacterium]|nr:hypothetical protein [Verrucomicrobiales bacterium]